ncbi:MAG TPA: DnaD domain protein [Ruminiclostridium sp.]|nr:DnaD domain protein [Ruminiclostridium sp.]
MARPQKQTVDYFPHLVGDSKTKFILENKYGNDGYAFWFKLLELLCKSDGHYYNCNGITEWEYLIALTKVSEAIAKDILNKLSEMGNIDPELWDNKIIWCQSLVDNISDAYKKRTVSVPQKPTFTEFPHRKPDLNEVSVAGNPQIKLNNTILNKEDEEERAREGEIYKFFNQNICPITPFQAETISKAIDEDGLEPEMILEVLKDSLGKRDKWSWINRVLTNAARDGTKTLEQYTFKKTEKAETKSRDAPPKSKNVSFADLAKEMEKSEHAGNIGYNDDS